MMINPASSLAPGEPAGEVTSLATQVEAWIAGMEEARTKNAAAADPHALGTYGTQTGFFALFDGKEMLYSHAVRLHVGPTGRLFDDEGRSVLGFPAGAAAGESPKALYLPAARGGPFAGYEMDDRGVIFGLPAQTGIDARRSPVELARVCISMFPAPQELIRRGDAFVAAPAAGRPSFWPAGSANVGILERQPSASPLARIRASARDMWLASARAEIEVALAGSRDALTRVALDVVK